MSSVNPKSKVCPSCRLLTPPELQVIRISRSSGKQTTSFRCKKCDEMGKTVKR
jgi:RNase P subunit RPR2